MTARTYRRITQRDNFVVNDAGEITGIQHPTGASDLIFADLVSGAGNLTTANRQAVAAEFARAPLIGAPLLAQSTAYAGGREVKHSNGQLLYCVTGGTTGASEPTFNAAQPIADGTAVWWALGQVARTASAGRPVPTISVGTSITGLVATLIYSNQSKFSHTTCPNILDYAGVASQAWCFNSGGSGNDQGMGTGLRGYLRVTEFWSDAPKVAVGIHTGGGSGMQIFVSVDGDPLEQDPTPYVAGNPSYYTIDWSTVAGRKMRKYRVECSGNTTLKSVAVDSQSVILATDTSKDTKGVWISDSFGGTVSTYSTGSPVYLSERVMKRLGVRHTRNLHVGGMGVIATGTGTGAPLYNAPNLLLNNPQTGWDAGLVVWALGYNDIGANIAAFKAAALQTWQTLRVQYPRAYILVYGVWSSSTGPSANCLALDTATSEQFAAWGDANAAFISIAQDPTGSWTSGTGKSSALTGSGNADFYTGADGIHPTLNGVAYLEERMVAAGNVALAVRV